jgi:hypothetical protein
MSDASREFLFTYRFDGKEWGISIFAADAAEAREKIKAVGMARFGGELMARIPASLPAAGSLARFICWWRNSNPGATP